MKVIWLTGPSEAGKTTLAKALLNEIPCVNLDGDEMRNSISLGAGFSREDRREHNLRVARLAKVLSEQKTVVVSVIAPMVDVRDEINEICSPIWIRLTRREDGKQGFYEISPEYPVIDADNLDVGHEIAIVRMIADLNPRQPASMFIGRYQPLHRGHIDLIKTVLDEGRDVVVALRDTVRSNTDPYTIGQRKEMFQEAFAVYGDRVNVITVPDIEEVCYGRKVGWGIREIRLDAEIEEISATKIREKETVPAGCACGTISGKGTATQGM